MREINLLPPVRRRLLRNESLLVSITGIVQSINAALILISSIAAIVIAVVWVITLTAAVTTETELAEQINIFRMLRTEISEKNLMLTYLEDMSRSRIVWSDALHDVLGVAPGGVTFGAVSGGLQVLEGEIDSAQVTLEGKAPTRRTLELYKEALQNVERVGSVDSPSSNLLLRDNPPYSFTVHLRAAGTSEESAIPETVEGDQ